MLYANCQCSLRKVACISANRSCVLPYELDPISLITNISCTNTLCKYKLKYKKKKIKYSFFCLNFFFEEKPVKLLLLAFGREKRGAALRAAPLEGI